MTRRRAAAIGGALTGGFAVVALGEPTVLTVAAAMALTAGVAFLAWAMSDGGDR